GIPDGIADGLDDGLEEVVGRFTSKLGCVTGAGGRGCDGTDSGDVRRGRSSVGTSLEREGGRSASVGSSKPSDCPSSLLISGGSAFGFDIVHFADGLFVTGPVSEPDD